MGLEGTSTCSIMFSVPGAQMSTCSLRFSVFSLHRFLFCSNTSLNDFTSALVPLSSFRSLRACPVHAFLVLQRIHPPFLVFTNKPANRNVGTDSTLPTSHCDVKIVQSIQRVTTENGKKKKSPTTKPHLPLSPFSISMAGSTRSSRIKFWEILLNSLRSKNFAPGIPCAR